MLKAQHVCVLPLKNSDEQESPWEPSKLSLHTHCALLLCPTVRARLAHGTRAMKESKSQLSLSVLGADGWQTKEVHGEEK